MQLRQRTERGHTQIDWLDSYHTFSFGEYYDPAHMGFGDLRVINDDRVKPGGGFDTHGHRDMEIVTYILEGTLAHKDNMGNGSLIQPGDVQRMTAGTGVLHSEFNPSETDPVHLLQIWIKPEAKGLSPGYEQRSFMVADKNGRWCLIASRDGRDGSVTVHQDVAIQATILTINQQLAYELLPERMAWVQVARGVVQVNDRLLEAGDAVAVTEIGLLTLEGMSREAEVLLFDLRQH